MATPTIYDDMVRTIASRAARKHAEYKERAILDFLVEMSRFGWIASKDHMHIFNFRIKANCWADQYSVSEAFFGMIGVNDVFEGNFRVLVTDFEEFWLASPTITKGEKKFWDVIFEDLYALEIYSSGSVFEYFLGKGWEKPSPRMVNPEDYKGLTCSICSSPMLKWQGRKICSSYCKKRYNRERTKRTYAEEMGVIEKPDKRSCEICGSLDGVNLFQKTRPLCRKHFQSEYRKLRKAGQRN